MQIAHDFPDKLTALKARLEKLLSIDEQKVDERINSYEVYFLTKENVENLKTFGIDVEHYNDKNAIAICKDFKKVSLKVNFVSCIDSILIIDCDKYHGFVRFEANRSAAILSKTTHRNQISLTLRGSENLFSYGPDCSSNGIEAFVDGKNRKIDIGQDCMFAYGVQIRTSDSHAIFDTDTKTVMNVPKDISLGRHVWVGTAALILKGVDIGDGSIIAARSVVTKSIPSRCVAAGIPAKATRKNVSWTRQASPTEADIDFVLQSYFDETSQIS